MKRHNEVLRPIVGKERFSAFSECVFKVSNPLRNIVFDEEKSLQTLSKERELIRCSQDTTFQKSFATIMSGFVR